MSEKPKQPGDRLSAAGSQTRARYEVNLPVSLKITTSVMTQPFNVRSATIRYIGQSAGGVSLVIETKTTREELSKILVRRRTCYTICQFPGASRPARLFGEIDSVQPRITANDILVRIGVTLDVSKPETVADLMAYLKSLEDASRAPSPPL